MNYLVTYKYVEDVTKMKNPHWGDDYFLITNSNLSGDPGVEYIERKVTQLKETKKLSSVILTGIFPFGM